MFPIFSTFVQFYAVIIHKHYHTPTLLQSFNSVNNGAFFQHALPNLFVLFRVVSVSVLDLVETFRGFSLKVKKKEKSLKILVKDGEKIILKSYKLKLVAFGKKRWRYSPHYFNPFPNKPRFVGYESAAQVS